MMKNYLIATLLFLNFFVNAQNNTPPEPAGCDLFSVIDTDGDGFAEFDTNWFVHVYVPSTALFYEGIDLTNYSMHLYPSDDDMYNETNEIVGPTYVNVVPFYQFTSLSFAYIGPEAEYDAMELMYLQVYFRCHVLETISPNSDYDNDGIPNIDEDLNGNLNLTDDDTDGDFGANFMDSDVSLGMKSLEAASLNISPNPASGIINLHFGTEIKEKFDLSVYDVSGKVVLSLADSNGTAIDISHLTSGMYFLKINTDNYQAVRKLMVK